MVNNPQDKSPYEKWYGKAPKWVSNLRTFGEIGIIQDGSLGKIKSKLKNRCFPAMFIGYPPNHSSDVFQLFVLSKRSIILSRNVVWLNKTYGDYQKVPQSERSKCIDPVPIDEVDSDDDNDDMTPLVEGLGMEILRGVGQNLDITPLVDTDEEDNQPNDNRVDLNPLNAVPITDDENEDEVSVASQPHRVSGINRIHRNLTTFYNPDPSVHIDEANF